MRSPSVTLCCAQCSTSFNVPNGRRNSAKFCSRECADKAPKKRNEVRCRECGVLFKLKKSHSERSKAWGNFCSASCNSTFRSRVTTGEGNANFKGRNFDHDGYRVFSPQASLGLGLGRMKMHHAVSLMAVGLKKVPSGMHVHHRDCDQLNNEPWNLAFMTASDHKWLHHQFGVATLRAIMNGDVDPDEACCWSDDPIRASSLLISNVQNQGGMMEYLVKKFGCADIGYVSAMRGIRVDLVEVDGGFGST